MASRRLQSGFSLIEILLAAGIFAILVTGLVGALAYGQNSTASSGDYNRATMLADEGLQAVRNIQNSAFTNLSAGTFGLAQAANVWTLSGSSDTTGIFTRKITITSTSTNRLSVTSSVSWTPFVGLPKTVSAVTELTNWAAVLRSPSWTTPTLLGSVNSTALKVATQGTNAYVVRAATSSNFSVISTATTTAPTVTSTISITGTPTNIAVSGNYAYVTTNNPSGELVVVNITNPALPVVAATYNAAGSASGLGIYISGNYAYLSRAANGGSDELVILNISTPSSPTRVYGFNINLNLNEVYVNATTIYVVTTSGTSQVIALTPVVFGLTYTQVSTPLTGTTAATTIAGNVSGTNLFVGDGTNFYVIGTTLMNILGSVTLTGTINDVDYNTNGTYVYAATSNPSGELQVIDVSALATPTLTGSVDVPGTSSTLTGVSYNSTQNAVVAVGASTSQPVAVFGPN